MHIKKSTSTLVLFKQEHLQLYNVPDAVLIQIKYGLFSSNRRNDMVVKVSGLQLVDLGFINKVEYQKL